jgi:hypothetical protein
MREPPYGQSGRPILFFAAIVLVLALWMSLGNGQWIDSALWYALAAFLGCYGLLMSNLGERWNRPLLVAGLLAGVVAFGMALRMVGLLSF